MLFISLPRVLNDPLGKDILDILLNSAAQVARAVGDGVGLPHEVVDKAVVPREGDVLSFITSRSSPSMSPAMARKFSSVSWLKQMTSSTRLMNSGAGTR